LVAGTIECVAANGLEGTTVRTIAAASRVSHGLVGHYFRDREELLVESHKQLCDQIEEAVDRARTHETSPLGRLAAVPETVFSAGIATETNLKAYLAFWHASAIYPGIRENHANLTSRYRASLGALYEAAAAERGVTVDVELAAFSLTALLDGLWLHLALDTALTRERAIAACRGDIESWLKVSAPSARAPATGRVRTRRG
jgi:AcrR family transcriptional regulator